MKRRPSLPQKLFLMLVVPIALVGGLLGATELVLRATREAAEDYWVVDGAHLRPGIPGPRPGARFHPDSIPLERNDGVVRVFCLGGSTTYGHPFDPPAAFRDWIAARLLHLAPDRRFEIFNLGSNGFNAEAVLDLARCTWPAQPDWLVVYTGHNEFLAENLSPIRSPITHAVRRALRGTRLGDRWNRPRDHDDRTAADIGERRQVWVHDEAFVDERQRRRGLQRFEQHCRRLLEEAREHGARVVFCLPVSDALDTPPQVSSFGADTDEATRAWIRDELRTLDPLLRSLDAAPDEEDRRDRLQALVDADPAVARSHWLLGRALLRRGEREEAARCLEQARELDGHPIRAVEEIRRILRRLEAPDCLIADPRPWFEREAARGIPGQPRLFVDYCHPTLHGHCGIADVVLRRWAEAGAFGAPWDFEHEPPLDDIAVEMGADAAAQARNLARRALAALATAYFQPDGDRALDAAESLIELAHQTDPDCALAHAALGFVRCAQERGEEGLQHLQRAHQLDPPSLRPLAEAERDNVVVRELFHTAGVCFVDGQPRSLGDSRP